MGSGNNRNFFIAIGLSVVVLIAWYLLFANPQQTAQQLAEQTQTATTTATDGTPTVTTTTDIAGATVAATAAGDQIYADREQAIASTARVPIETGRVSGSINLSGGRIDDLRLTDYHETTDDESPTIVLLSPANGPSGYFAEFGWVNGQTPVVNFETQWTAPAGAVLTPETPVTLTYDNGAGLVFSRTISIDVNYMFTVTDSVVNNGTDTLALTPYGRITRLGEPTSKGAFILHEGMIGVIGDQGLQEVKYSALTDEPRTFDPATHGWLGITDKYWAAALIPDQEETFSGRFDRFDDAAGIRYQAAFTGQTESLAPGASATSTNNLFAGAKEVKVLEGYTASMHLDRFEYLVDWGLFYFITKPMFQLIDWLYNLVGNFGVAILLVTVLAKLVFFPLANRSYRSMAAMRRVGPQVTAMRERYKDDKPKQQQAMMEIYKKEKINPIAGCWPVLIQIPVFFSLYKVLYVTIEMRHAPFFGWIQDLSAPDPTSIFNLFGLLPFTPPLTLMIGVWPIIMGISMWVQFQLNPQTPGTPKWIFNILPLVFTFMLSSFPAGLVIYWAWNNSLSVLQQSIIMRRNGVPVDIFGNIRSTFRRKKAGAGAKS